VAPTPAELAEDTLAHVVPSPMFEPHARDGYVLVSGRRAAWVTRVRRVDENAVLAEAWERGAERVEWWLGWNAPPGGEPTYAGMTLAEPPPTVPEVELRPARPEDVAAVETAVWGSSEPVVDHSSIRHTAAFVDTELVGYGRSVDLDGGVALMGGAVLEDARGRGVYRALVRARWEHAVARGTPLLVVQAGELSAPILSGLGFETHGEIRVRVTERS
jgi:GNAT superfamily N-acetyltransferase